MTLLEKIALRLEQRQDEMIKIRRYLHENPELSFQEKETANYILNFYKDKDCKVRHFVGDGYGIVVDIEGKGNGKTIAIRADFDALPIEEQTGLEFSSKNKGVMHACGHDVHTAYLMILADTLIEFKNELNGNVRIIHQPAEEVPPGGAKSMIEDGCLDGVDAIFGIHIASGLPTGMIAYRKGVTQSGRATFKVEIEGRGGHGSSPHTANDAIVAAANFVTAIQTIVSRRINPADTVTVTIGSFDARGSANIINEKATLLGDIRVMNEDMRPIVEEQFKTILDGICKTYKMNYKLDYENDYPVLVNDAEMTDFAINTIRNANIKEITHLVEMPAAMPSEDFAYYLQKVPGCFYFVGAHKEGTVAYEHHNPKFNIDENSLEICAKSMLAVVLQYLK